MKAAVVVAAALGAVGTASAPPVSEYAVHGERCPSSAVSASDEGAAPSAC